MSYRSNDLYILMIVYRFMALVLACESAFWPEAQGIMAIMAAHRQITKATSLQATIELFIYWLRLDLTLSPCLIHYDIY